MFNKTNPNTGIQLVIDAATAELLKHEPQSVEYQKIVEQLDKLTKIANSNRSDKVSKDTLWSIIGNLTGIGIIVGHERFAVITSKAIGFVGKFR